MHKLNYSVYAAAIILYGLYVFFMPHEGLPYDIECWIQWAQSIHEHSLGAIYKAECNYLPGHLIEFKAYTLLFPSKVLIAQNIHYLKYFTFIFDVAGALLVCSLLPGTRNQMLILFAMLLNPAFVHNTVAWGQFDSVFSFFIFASCISLFRKNIFLSAMFFLISINFKLQAIMFVPVLILMAAVVLEFRIDWKKLLLWAAGLIAIQVLILLPFILQGTWKSVFYNVKGLAGDYSYISLKAANIWHLMMSGDLRWTADWNTFQRITFKRWGFIMMCVTLFITVVPMLKSIYLKLKKTSAEIPLEKLLLIFCLVPLCFYYFNTQMHERYSYPVFLFIAGYSAITKRWWLYILFSSAYFLNNEGALKVMTFFNFNSFMFDFRFIASLYLATITSCILFLYKGFKSKPEPKSVITPQPITL